ncbi:MAG: class I SAM-dependent methyltransferase [Burkholderiales bacterium]
MANEATVDRAAFKEFERLGYSRAASIYRGETARVTSQVNEPLLDAIGAKPGMRMLDVACGPGRLSGAAAKRGCIVTGLDYAEPMVNYAKEAFPDITFRVGDAEALPFEAEQFDLVTCSLGILHFADPDQAMREARRVLVTGGRYAFTCWVPPARNPFMALILGSVQKHGTTDLPLPPGPPMFRFGEPAECERTVREIGMKVVSTTELSIEWDFDSPEQVVPIITGSTARLAPMLSLQAPEQRRDVERAITEGARQYLKAGRVSIPAPITLVVASKT